jgi:hypothetical protein
MTGTPGNGGAWRDLAFELTPDRIAELESLEEHTSLQPDMLLFLARHDAARNLEDKEFGHIAPPPDAAASAGTATQSIVMCGSASSGVS